MKTKLTNDCYVDGKVRKKGDVVQVEKEVFESLQAKECAEKEFKGRVKPVNRQIKTDK